MRFRLALSVIPLAIIRCGLLKVFGNSFVFAGRDANAPCADRAAIAREIFEAFRRSQCGALHLDGLPAAGEFWELLQDRTVRGGYQLVIPDTRLERMHRLEIAGSYPEYLTTLSNKTRRNLRIRTERLWDAMGQDAYVIRVTRPEQVRAFLDQVDRMYSRTWQSRTFGYMKQNGESSVALLEGLARHGWLRSYLLVGKGEPIAYVIGFQYRGTCHYDSPAYDQRFGHLAPGTALTRWMIEDLFEHDRPAVLDFGFGENQYKQVFGNVAVDACTAYLVRSTRWRILLCAQRALACGEYMVRDVLTRFNLAHQVRDLVKRRTSWRELMRPAFDVWSLTSRWRTAAPAPDVAATPREPITS